MHGLIVSIFEEDSALFNWGKRTHAAISLIEGEECIV